VSECADADRERRARSRDYRQPGSGGADAGRSALNRPLHGQLSHELPPEPGRRGLVLSASKEIESGARGDAAAGRGPCSGSTSLSVVTRCARSCATCLQASSRSRTRTAAPADASVAYGDAASYQPGSSGLDFTLDQGAEAGQRQGHDRHPALRRARHDPGQRPGDRSPGAGPVARETSSEPSRFSSS